MKPLYTQIDFDNTKSISTLKLQCYQCNKQFLKQKRYITLALNKHVDANGKDFSGSCRFCSKKCNNEYNTSINSKIVTCKNCNVDFKKTNAELKKFPNSFCSHSCSASFNNKNKSHGNRRSKLEVYIEEKLTALYPSIPIDYNKKDAINSELDIYIPSLSLAIGLNGIFHYEPIFGPEKLSKIQNNDQRKFQACLENGIELVLIDVSQFGYFKPVLADKFLFIITKIIDNKINIVPSGGFEPAIK